MSAFEIWKVDIPTVVTSLPGSPVTGDEVYLKAGSGDTAVYWHLRYDSSITDSYKWFFLGGSPLHARVNTGEATSSTSYTDLTTVGPSVTIPNIGVYRIHHGCYIIGGSAVPLQNIQSNGSDPGDDDEGVGGIANSGSGSHSAEFQRTISSIGTSATVKARYRVSSGTSATFYRRWMSLIPVRIG